MKNSVQFYPGSKYSIHLLFIFLMICFGTIRAKAQTCPSDQTAADFGKGTTTGTYISSMDDGEVILQPAAGAEFNSLPPTDQWNSANWQTDGSITISGGVLTVDGARFNTEPETLTFGPGTSLEFKATFQADNFQHIGFGAGTDAAGSGGIFNGEHSWAMFSTWNNGSLNARTFNGPASSNVPISGDYLGSPHVYKIVWVSASEFDYFIDGSLVQKETGVDVEEPMRVAISDFNTGTPVLVDWIHVSPYGGTEGTGTFESQIFDGKTKTAWGTVSIAANVPAGTSLVTEYRTGYPWNGGIKWSDYDPISDGQDIPYASRYIQYRVTLSTTDNTITPVFKGFSVSGCAFCTLKAQITNSTNVSCFGKANGSFTISASGGTPPYQYKRNADGILKPGPADTTLTSLKPGIYNMYVQDANGCSVLVRDTITQPEKIVVSEVTELHKDVTCQGGKDGSLTVSVTPGSTTDYTYKKGNKTQASPTFSNLKAGTYKIIAINNTTGCQGSVMITILDGNPCFAANNNGDNRSDAKAAGNDLSIKALPNPSATEFTLMLSGNSKENVAIKVTDMFGKNVYETSGPSTQQYRFGNTLPSGIYIVQVTQGSSVKTIKVIKQ